MICNDPDKAETVLNRSGYINRITQAIVDDMKDQAGGLDELLKVASDSNVSLDYIYTSFHRKDLRPVVICIFQNLLIKFRRIIIVFFYYIVFPVIWSRYIQLSYMNIQKITEPSPVL